MKKWIGLFLFLSVLIILGACSKESSAPKTDKKEVKEEKLLVGVTAGPHEQILEKVAEVAAKDGLKIELKVFSDFVLPNEALANKEIDANSFQHRPFLEEFKADKGLDLTPIADTILNPMGIYSDKIKDLKELKKGDKLGLPNDPTNGSRALNLFEEAGLIKLNDENKEMASIKDVVENPLNLELVELDAAQLPKLLDELAAAAINTSYAVSNGLIPSEDAVYLESTENNPFLNVIAVRTEDKDKPVFQKLIKAYHTDEVKQFIKEEFKGSIVTSW
jgi:D-methionine transport system substrate-binding protein